MTQQRTEIIEYAKEHEIIDAEFIANALKLDVFDVDIMTTLIEEGILEEVIIK